MTTLKVRQHREIPEGYQLNSMTVSREASGKYYASLLYEYAADENQAAVKKAKAEYKILGIDYAMSGMAVFSDGNRMDRDVNAAINIREEGKRMICA